MNYYIKILVFYLSFILHLLLIQNYSHLLYYLNLYSISTSCLFHLYLALFISHRSLCLVWGLSLAVLRRIFDGVWAWGLGIMLRLAISERMILKIRFIFLARLLFLLSSHAPILRCCTVCSNCYTFHLISKTKP